MNNHSLYAAGAREVRRVWGSRLVPHPPTGKIRINKLAREIGVSPGSIKSYADAFEQGGLLTVTRLGTVRLFSLDNDSPAARELNRACMILFLERGLIRSDTGAKGRVPGSPGTLVRYSGPQVSRSMSSAS